MRTLELNKTTLWMVYAMGKEPILDDEGYKTGEYQSVYEGPIAVRLSLYPSDGKVVEQIFGRDNNYDMIAVSEIELPDNALLFKHYPHLGNFDNDYSYRIASKKVSLNVINYGLELRTGGK